MIPTRTTLVYLKSRRKRDHAKHPALSSPTCSLYRAQKWVQKKGRGCIWTTLLRFRMLILSSSISVIHLGAGPDRVQNWADWAVSTLPNIERALDQVHGRLAAWAPPTCGWTSRTLLRTQTVTGGQECMTRSMCSSGRRIRSSTTSACMSTRGWPHTRRNNQTYTGAPMTSCRRFSNAVPRIKKPSGQSLQVLLSVRIQVRLVNVARRPA
ncbi:hypothetical protein EDB86DRAFT_1913908 [Lactarius hatsudake]|nr:hypothetical protein EDB86DRAFT_1913908 [Lactarius hatsudake]